MASNGTISPEKRENSVFQALIRILHKIEEGILVGLLLVMIGMAVTQIVLRNVFESGIVWGDVLVRILVLWIGLAGAMVASQDDKHIRIDIVSRYLPGRIRCAANCMTHLFTSIICSIVAWYSFKFVQMEFESGGNAFARIPVWICESVIPFAFMVIALRYFIMAFTTAKQSCYST